MKIQLFKYLVILIFITFAFQCKGNKNESSVPKSSFFENLNLNVSNDSNSGCDVEPNLEELDIIFGNNGKVITEIGSITHDIAKAVAVQSDGKIIVAGASYRGNSDSGNSDFVVVRYNNDGSLDMSFGSNGKVITDIGINTYDIANAIALQSDGKIVVAGYSEEHYDDGSLNQSAVIVRYNIDGSLDASFAGTGKVKTQLFGIREAYAIALQSDGKIVIAGYSPGYYYYNYDDFAVARYNSDGSLDTSFDYDGKVITDIGSNYDRAYAVAIQSDGKIVVAGETRNGSDVDIAIVRYNTNGSLDTSFDYDGKVITAIGNGDVAYDVANAMAIQPDGKIVVAGHSVGDFALVRYNSNGSLDVTFGGTGKVITEISSNHAEQSFGIALQSDGKIVVTGSSSDKNLLIVRYNDNGTLDTTFGNTKTGKITTDIGCHSYDESYAIAIQSDGKIVIAGTSHNGSDLDFTVIRILP